MWLRGVWRQRFSLVDALLGLITLVVAEKLYYNNNKYNFNIFYLIVEPFPGAQPIP